MNLLGNVIALPFIMLTSWVVLREPAVGLSGMFYGVVSGLFALSVANIAWRKVNLVTVRLGINAMSYLTPIFGLLWIYLFSDFRPVRISFLLIGAATVITANLLINFAAEIRWGFRALVLSLVGCGTVVYLRDAFFQVMNVESWRWGTAGDYFEATSLSATVFTLLLAFRVARLVGRMREEDNLTLSWFRQVQYLVESGDLDPGVLDRASRVTGEVSGNLERDYDAISRSIEGAVKNAENQLRERLLAAQAGLDSLVYSKQQGINFSEMASLVIFAGMTVSLALFTRPEMAGMTGLLIEFFTILFSSVVIFLTANVWDLQRDRSARVLTGDGVGGGYRIVFDGTGSRRLERVMSVIVGFGVAAVFAGLLGHKWMGWFG